MKIINSHYIPMPEPRWLIIAPNGEIYEQIGTLTTVEEAPAKKGKYGIKTYSHPVVAFSNIDYVEKTETATNIAASISYANGEVLDDVLINDCTKLCLSKHRVVNFVTFNLLVLKLLSKYEYEDSILEDLINTMKENAIKLSFPDEEMQEVTLTLSDDTESGGLIMSDPIGILFGIPCYATATMEGVYLEEDKIFMEFVNQARAYLKINPKYKFHFSTSMEIFNDLVERLNNELNDYLERKED